jgi:hypothetical protein
MVRKFAWDPEHWRFRAEEAPTLVDEMKDETSRQMMLQIAEGYESLAKHVEAKMRYFVKVVHSWDEFVGIVSGHEGRWVYRGQPKDWPLQSSLEKYIRAWDSDIAFAIYGRQIRRRGRPTALGVWRAPLSL